MQKNRKGEHRYTNSREVIDLIDSLARHLPDQGIAEVLNRLQYKTAKGNGWTESRVCSARNVRGIAVYKPGERRVRGELLLREAAEFLGMTQRAVRTLIDNGTLPADQACPGAPWVIYEKNLLKLDGEEIKMGPSHKNSRQKTLKLQ